jgi:outer membrane biosynthesis protein TonB
MAKNEDGEFELILGNRQLLSVFFIVVVLLGVFFTMGYIVGRNSNPITGPETVAAARKDSKPVVIDAPPHDTPKTSPPAASLPPTETAAQLPPKEEPKPAETPKPEPPPKREPPKAEPVKSEAIKAAPPKAQPPKPEPAKPVKQAPPPAATTSTSRPAGGETYLQLAATAKAEADVMLDVLHKKGFKAIATQIPDRPGLYRVFVGPIADTDVNKTRSDLHGAGFPGDKAIRKTF